MGGLLKLIQKLYGKNALAKTIGTRTNVIRLPDNEIKKFTKTPTVAIGGINAVNYKNLLLNNANFLAISGYIWKNKKYKPIQAIERLK